MQWKYRRRFDLYGPYHTVPLKGEEFKPSTGKVVTDNLIKGWGWEWQQDNPCMIIYLPTFFNPQAWDLLLYKGL